MHVELAEKHRARLLEATNDLGIFGGYALAILIAGGSGEDARCVEEIFECDRDTVQWAAIVAGGDFGFSAARGIERSVGGDRDERVELGIQPLDAAETFAREFDGRKFAGADLVGGVEESEHA